MNVLTWILSGLLAVAFLASGLAKLATPRAKLAAKPRMGWADDFTDQQVKGIGALEFLGGLGVVLPWLLDIAKVLTPLAALGLAGVMVGATMVHRRRGETDAFPITLGLCALGLVVAVLRFTQL